MAWADRMPPYEFFEELRRRPGAGTANRLAWADAADPLDEFPSRTS